MSRFSSLFKEILRGKSVSRTLTNLLLSRFVLEGRVLDVGGTRKESHYRYLSLAAGAEVKTVNLRAEEKPDYAVDLESAPIPASDGEFDAVLCFNLLEHVERYEKVVDEMRRVLKPGGRFVGSVPFLVNVHPDPHDFQRFTAEKLERLLEKAGFREIKILPASFGPFLAAYSQAEMFIPRFLKIIAFPLAYTKDFLLLRFFGQRFPFRDRFVLAYVFSALK